MLQPSKNDLGVKIAVAGIVAFMLLFGVVLGVSKAKESMGRRHEEAVVAKANKKQTEIHQALLVQARDAAGNFDKIDEAFVLFEQAEALGPVAGEDAVVYARLLKNRGEEKAGAGRLDEALVDLRKAKALAPDLDGFYVAIAGIEKRKAEADAKIAAALAEVEKRQREIDAKIVAAFVALKKEERTLPALNVCATLDRCVAVWEEGRKVSHGEEPNEAMRTMFRNGETYRHEQWHTAIATKLKIPAASVEAACAKGFEEIERQLAKIEGDRDEADLRKLFKKLAGGYVANISTGDVGHNFIEVTVGSAWHTLPKGSRSEEIRALALLLGPHLGRFHPGKSPSIKILDRTGTVIGRTGMFGGVSVDD